MSYQLENLAQMENYYGWLHDEFSPFIGRRVLEIGAGTGNFSRFLHNNEQVQQLWLVEPDQELATKLTERFAGINNLSVLQISAEMLTLPYLATLNIDTIVMVNVLEHIESDIELLKSCAAVLPRGGRVLTFSPAFPLLMSKYDRLVGHYRRYTKKELCSKFTKAGLAMDCLKYFNFVGFFAWLLLVRLMRADTFGDAKLRIYEKMIVPLQFIEQRLSPPFGQSIIAVGRKP